MIKRIKQGCKRVMDYWAEYLGVTEPTKIAGVLPVGFSSEKFPKIFKPYSITTKTISYYSKPNKRDPARRWKK